MTKRTFILRDEAIRRCTKTHQNGKMCAVHKACRPYAPLPKTIVIRTNGMSDSNSTFKFCPECQSDTDRVKDGRCKPCEVKRRAEYHAKNKEKRNTESAAWRELNKEKKKADAAEYYKNNSEARKEYSRAWREANPELASATLKNYSITNREKRNQATAIWRAANPEKVKQRFKLWSAANPQAGRIRAQNRKSRKLLNGGVLSSDLPKKLFKLQKGKCACCGKPLEGGYHLDHIMPLALGGANTDDNIQLLRPKCNLQKNMKHPIDFMQGRGYLL